MPKYQIFYSNQTIPENNREITKLEMHRIPKNDLTGYFPNVTEIKLVYRDDSRHKNLDFLMYFPCLQILRLDYCSFKDVRGLKHCPNLRRLYICLASDDLFHSAAKYCPKLEVLYMGMSREISLSQLANFSNLTTLGFRSSFFFDKIHIEEIAKTCPKLKKLDLCNEDMNGEEHLGVFTELESLTCKRVDSNIISKLTKLQYLATSNLRFIPELSNLVNLKYVWSGHTYDKSAECFRGCKSMEEFESMCGVCLENIDPFYDMPNLKRLEVKVDVINPGTLSSIEILKIDTKTITNIPKCPKIRELILVGDLQVNDQSFLEMPDLKVLRIFSSGKIDMSMFKSCYKLRELLIAGASSVVECHLPSVTDCYIRLAKN